MAEDEEDVGVVEGRSEVSSSTTASMASISAVVVVLVANWLRMWKGRRSSQHDGRLVLLIEAG